MRSGGGMCAWMCAFGALALGCSGSADDGGSPGDASMTQPGSDSGTASADGGGVADGGGGRIDATVSDGAPGDAASSGPCPAQMALVSAEAGAACIDLYEGALLHRESDGGETPWPFYTPVDDHDAGEFRAVPAAGVYPQGYISQVQATAACRASGKRLCTFDEWTSACRGRPAHDYVYPYGDTYEAGRCNEGHESPIVELFGPTPSYDNTELNDPRCDQLEGGLARGGAFARCESTYGAFDMHGNIHEWIDDSPNAAQPALGAFMGGYFVDATENGPGCTYETTAHEKTYHDYSTGFRCCADVSGGG